MNVALLLCVVLNVEIEMDQTPKLTPRRRLGMRRIVPQSAPSKILVHQTPATPLSTPTPLRENSARVVCQSVPSKRIHKIANASTSDAPSTPLIRKKCRVMVKRLNMTDLPSTHKTDTTTNTPDVPSDSTPVDETDEQISRLENRNKELKNNIKQAEQHESRVNDLKEQIDKWTGGAVKALKLLKSKIQPTQSTASILNHLQIPIEILGDSLPCDEESS